MHRNRDGRQASGSCLGRTVKFVVTVGIIILVWWLIFRPHKIKVNLEGTAMYQFSLADGNTTLRYNLTADLSVRNPSVRIGVYYDFVEATALYGGSRLESVQLPPFYQHHKNTTLLHPAWGGQAAGLGAPAAATFGREKALGWFNVEMKLYTRVRFKVMSLKFGHYTRKFDCMARVPAPSDGGMSYAGSDTREVVRVVV